MLCTVGSEESFKSKKGQKSPAILMNPQNGEIYALVSLPEYDLNEPFTLIEEYKEQGKRQWLSQTARKSGCLPNGRHVRC